MSIGTFDPNSVHAGLSDNLVKDLTELARAVDPQHPLKLDQKLIDKYAAAASHADWPNVVGGVASDDLVALVRLFTLGEAQYTAWHAGAKSPVIVCCRELKSRDAWPADLLSWIRQHSDNRFIPYGSLLDRL